MTTEKIEQQFSQDVDRMLETRRIVEDVSAVEDYQQEIALAFRLMETSFIPDSSLKNQLKIRLFSTSDQVQGRHKPGYNRRLLTAPAWFIFLFFVLMIVLLPLGMTSAQEAVVQIIASWMAGEKTKVLVLDRDFELLPDEGDGVIILPATGENEPGVFPEDEAGNKPEGERIIMMDEGMVSFEAAQSLTNFQLRAPTYLPDGYELAGATVINAQQASLDFLNGSGGLIGLLQTDVSDREITIAGTADLTIEPLTINGVEGIWSYSGPGGEGLLIWEAEGVNYQLAGVSDLETAVHIAESLE